MKKILLLLGFLICTIISEAQISLYVDNSRAMSGNGTSWTSAFKTLNEALNLVNNHPASKYNIHIAKGTYYPTGIQAGTNRDSSFFLMRGGVSLYGGYPNGGGPRSAGANPTILSGNIGVDSLTTDNSYHIMVLMPDTMATADSIVINGLDFTQGNANGANHFIVRNNYLDRNDGGAIYNYSMQTPVGLYNCKFYGNKSSSWGGAIYNDRSRMDLVSCSFSGNNAPAGGCLYNYGSTRRISGCSFSSNNTLGEGPAIYSLNDSVVITNSTFSNNTGNTGGAIYSSYNNWNDATLTVSHCTFINNTSINNGGAIYDYSINSPMSHFADCSFEGNSGKEGGAIYAQYHNARGDINVIRQCSFDNNMTTNGPGGGVSITSYDCSFIIDSSTFSQNKAIIGGGVSAFKTAASSLLNNAQIRNSIFIADSASMGGGLFAGSGIDVANCRFQSNKADYGGGLYYISPDSSFLRNSILSGNIASVSGGGMFAGSGPPTNALTIQNSLFSGNKAGVSGGGLIDSLISPNIINCTFAGDTALVGNGIYNSAGSSPVIHNSIIWEGTVNGIVNAGTSTPAINYCVVQGGYPGAGIGISDPLFATPLPATMAPAPGGDYRLRACSPAINTGQNTGSYTGITDLAGNARLYGAAVDPGAYELQGTHPANITGISELCLGGTMRLTCTSPGGIWWSSDTTKVSVSATGLVTGMGLGTTAVHYKVSGSCADSAVKNITVSVLDTGVIYNNGVQLIAKQNGATYQWVDCANGYAPIAGQTGQTFMSPTAGNYAVIITWNGCTDTSACRPLIPVEVTSIAANTGALHIYPNPSAGTFTVQLKDVTPDLIRVKDITGRVLKQIAASGERTGIDLHHVPPGIYLVEAILGNRQYTGRVSIVY